MIKLNAYIDFQITVWLIKYINRVSWLLEQDYAPYIENKYNMECHQLKYN